MRSMKLAQGILATNAYRKKMNLTPLARCSCCLGNVETLNHLVGHCQEEGMVAIREQEVADTHEAIDKICNKSKSWPDLTRQLKKCGVL